MSTYRPFTAALLASVGCLAIAAPTQGVPTRDAAAQELGDEVDRIVGQYHERDQFNGTALVVEDDRVVLEKGYGLANFEWRIPNAPSTKFRLASITKQFTAALIMRLVDEKKVELGAPITVYLPDYRKDTGAKVTIHHLLNHTSGIPSCTAMPEFRRNARLPHALGEFIREYCSGDLQFEPGSRFVYNNSGYHLLGAIIERVTGKSYEAALHEQIFAPLGMVASGYDRNEVVLERRAAGYERRRGQLRNAPFIDMGNPYAAGSLYSTVGDLRLWDRALREGRLMSPAARATMFTPGRSSYGYGWFVRKAGTAEETHEHTGGIFGFNTLIRRVPARKRLIVLLANVVPAPRRPMADAIGRALDAAAERRR